MLLSVYDMTIPAYIRGLTGLLGIIEKTQAHAANKKIEDATVMEGRLILDQFKFSKQVQIACDNAKLFVTRLTPLTAPVYEDKETTLDELKVRLMAVITLLNSIKAEDFQGWETKKITFYWKPGAELSALHYVTQYALPNFYFHVTTAYSILRANGIEIGKTDYLTPLEWITTA